MDRSKITAACNAQLREENKALYGSLWSLEDKELILRYRNGDEKYASVLFTKHEDHLKKYSSKFANDYKCHQLDDELFDECCFAFSEALCSYDDTKGAQFYTFAAKIMFRRMLNCFTKNKSCVSVPKERFRRHRIVAYHYFSDDISSHEDKLTKIANTLKTTYEKTEQLLLEVQQNQNYAPLDEIKESEHMPETTDPFVMTYLKLRNAAIRRLPDSLKPEEREIVLMYFGFDNAEGIPTSVSDISTVFAVSEDAVYKTIQNACPKMLEVYKNGELADLAWIYRVLKWNRLDG